MRFQSMRAKSRWGSGVALVVVDRRFVIDLRDVDVIDDE